jgi:hypothetical protein
MPKEITGKSSKTELVMELIGVLKTEASLFETFLDLLERQQTALVKNDIAALNSITDVQRGKIIEAGELARKRSSLVSRIAAIDGAPENPTISNLLDSVSDDQAGTLGRLRNTILELNERISKIRLQNEMLINRSRENIMKMMELLARLKAPDDNYRGQGRRNEIQTSLALDRRA